MCEQGAVYLCLCFCVCVYLYICVLVCVYVCIGVLRSEGHEQCAPCGVQCRVTNQAISFIIIRSGLPHRTLLTRPHYKHYIILIPIFCPASVAFLVGGGEFAIRN